MFSKKNEKKVKESTLGTDTVLITNDVEDLRLVTDDDDFDRKHINFKYRSQKSLIEHCKITAIKLVSTNSNSRKEG